MLHKLTKIYTNYTNSTHIAFVGMLRKNNDTFYLEVINPLLTQSFARVVDVNFDLSTAVRGIDMNECTIERLFAVNPGQVIIVSQGNKIVAYLVNKNFVAEETANCVNPFDMNGFRQTLSQEEFDINKLNQQFVSILCKAATNFDGNLFNSNNIHDVHLMVNDKILVSVAAPYNTRFYLLKTVGNELKRIPILKHNIITLSMKHFVPVSKNDYIVGYDDNDDYVVFKNGMVVNDETIISKIPNSTIDTKFHDFNVAYNNIYAVDEATGETLQATYEIIKREGI